MSFADVPDLILEPMVRNALLEDLGSYGDITTRAVVPADTNYVAAINARDDAIVSGMQVAKLAFSLIDPALDVKILIPDGSRCVTGQTLMSISGRASSILSAERVALNFAGRLTGIATLTSRFVAETKGTNARVTCTRKTTPGLRLVEKLAVLHGGGSNHRFSLSDAILIKDNHIAAAGGVSAVLRAVKDKASHMTAVEIEVDNLEQLAEALETGGANAVLLDNMDNATLREAVQMVDGQILTEASGNVRLDHIASIAATGVDYISSGALTHSSPTVDLGLDF